MKILSWNCRGLGRSSTISRLRESIRLNLPDIIFLCETKQSFDFVKKTISKLPGYDNWTVREPTGRKGGMLAAWNQNVDVKHVWTNDFCMEMRVNSEAEEGDTWVIFSYASTDAIER